MEVPRRWTQIRLDHLRGLAMVVGAPDTGKSTLAQYLYGQMVEYSRVAYIDGDPGQSTLGQPTTITLAVGQSRDPTFPPQGSRRRYFIGDISPRGHMLPLIVGARRLLDEAFRQGAETVIYDTCGLIDAQQGGHALKMALIELLRPAAVFALQRDRELESFLLPLRLSAQTRVVDLPASHLAAPRDLSVRRANRADLFARYFEQAASVEVKWSRLAVFPRPRFMPDRIVALEDTDGFTLGLGIVAEIDQPVQIVTLHTPLRSLAGVDALHLGDVLLDRQTYQDRRL